MYKLLFAVCVAVIAVVVAWMGLQPLEKVPLSLRLEKDKAYRSWIGSERRIDPPALDGGFNSGWSEISNSGFCINPDPTDTLNPGKYRKMGGGMSRSGGSSFSPAYFGNVDTTDTKAVRLHYIKQLYSVAAENLSSMLIPLYFNQAFSPLKIAASLVVEPFDPPGEELLTKHGDKIPKGVRFSMLGLGNLRKLNNIDNEIDRLIALYPNKPVATGGSWKIITDSIGGYPVNQQTQMKVLDQKNGIVTLGLNSTSVTNGSPVLIDTCGVFMSIEFTASLSGTLEIEETTGLIDDAELEQKIEGIFRVDSLPDLEPPEPKPFEFTGEYKIQLKESKNTRLPGSCPVPMRETDSIDVMPVPVDTDVEKPEN